MIIIVPKTTVRKDNKQATIRTLTDFFTFQQDDQHAYLPQTSNRFKMSVTLILTIPRITKNVQVWEIFRNQIKTSPVRCFINILFATPKTQKYFLSFKHIFVCLLFQSRVNRTN